MPQRAFETFVVHFTLYRTFYEDAELLPTIIDNMWVTYLNEFGGEPVDSPRTYDTDAVRYNGPFLAGPGEEWDRVRLMVRGRARRRQEPIPTTVQHCCPADPPCPACLIDFRTRTADEIRRAYGYDERSTTDPLDAALRRYTDNINASVDGLGRRLDEETDDYPWTDAATWYREYADENYDEDYDLEEQDAF